MKRNYTSYEYYVYRAGVELGNNLKAYLGAVRPVLEYAVPVWQSISACLSDRIEPVLRKSVADNFSIC